MKTWVKVAIPITAVAAAVSGVFAATGGFAQAQYRFEQVAIGQEVDLGPMSVRVLAAYSIPKSRESSEVTVVVRGECLNETDGPLSQTAIEPLFGMKDLDAGVNADKDSYDIFADSGDLLDPETGLPASTSKFSQSFNPVGVYQPCRLSAVFPGQVTNLRLRFAQAKDAEDHYKNIISSSYEYDAGGRFFEYRMEVEPLTQP
ncbi:MAG: hypothetical protein LBR21_07830 [Propionibacteriaceae bacterium]|jgi:hypothetical protein|nr:hypothetical protein [Propionibacteriaceae bacterium]